MISIIPTRCRSRALAWALALSACLGPVDHRVQADDAVAPGETWHVRQPAWSTADELAYQDFVRALGYVAFEKRCDTDDGACGGIADLLASSGNRYRASDPAWVRRLHTDCADFPLTLRAYFAWKNHLPHAVAHGIVPDGYCGVVIDTRFCKNGNRIVSRRAVTTGTPAREVLRRWSVDPTTAIFRTHFLDDKGIGSDFYTPAIRRDSITPGTIIYDPNGHTSMVFDVLDDGRALFVEAKISGEIDAGYLSPAKMPIQSDKLGWGFKKWKPVTLVGATRNGQGDYVGGRTVLPRAPEVPGYASTQYTARQADSDDRYRHGEQWVSYHDFVRLRLAEGERGLDPVAEIGQQVDAACIGFQDRVRAVDHALRVGMANDPHPERLPPNIYGTGGHWQWNHWETYSSPSRDAHLKTALVHLLDTARDRLTRHRDGDPVIDYHGDDLAGDMLDAYHAAAARCQVTYTNSAGQPVTLDFAELSRRVFRLSFDPYHCAELRWGATGEELASCPADPGKMRWYENQQYLRNQVERRYEDRTDFTVDELASPRPGNGVVEPPDIDVAGYLRSRSAMHTADAM